MTKNTFFILKGTIILWFEVFETSRLNSFIPVLLTISTLPLFSGLQHFFLAPNEGCSIRYQTVNWYKTEYCYSWL